YLILLVWLSVPLLTTCTPSRPTLKPWREELKIIVSQDQGSVAAEFRQQLIALFAKQLQLKIKLLPLPLDQVTQALTSGKAHFSDAGLRSNSTGGLRF